MAKAVGMLYIIFEGEWWLKHSWRAFQYIEGEGGGTGG